MLSAILLPVISITDDLHASEIPAEVERTCGWSHRNHASVQAPHNLPVALALLSSLLRPAGPSPVAVLAADEAISHHPFRFVRALWSRPPPIA
jgi:hypothetical protein